MDLVEHAEVGRRLELALDGQAGGLLDGAGAAAEVAGATVGAAVLPVVRVTSTTWSSSLAATATSASWSGRFTAMVRSAWSDSSMPQKAHWSLVPQ